MGVLQDLVNEINVPKSQFNSFGGYNFRNNEDIQTALKPLLKKYDLKQVVNTEVFECNSELIVGVHVALHDNDGNVITGDGYAVVDVNKKGMDKAQATGASMSYASKYAYGQMLMLDDIRDADSPNRQQVANKRPPQSKAPQARKQQPQQPPKAKQPEKKMYKKSWLLEQINLGTMTSDHANELYKNGQVIDDMKGQA